MEYHMEFNRYSRQVLSTYSMKDLRGQALQDPNEIIFVSSLSNLSSSGWREVNLPIGTRYSSISNYEKKKQYEQLDFG